MIDVPALLDGVMRIDPSAEAIEWEGRWTSWAAFDGKVGAIAALIDGLGLPKGARVGVLLRNRLPQLAALFATIRQDACLVTLNPAYPDASLAEDIDRLALPLLVGERADLDRAGIAEASSRAGTALIVLDEEGPSLMQARDASVMQTIAAPDVMIEMLTSGTTGKPKRVALTRNAFQHSFTAALAYEGDRAGAVEPKLRSGTQILVAPLTHIGGIWGAINTVAAGRRMVLLEKFRVAPWHGAVVRHRPVVASMTSAGLRMILDADIARADLASIRVLTAGAAPVEPEVIDAFWDRYGIPVLSNYGATEFAGPVAGWSLADFKDFRDTKRGSAGRVHREVDARVVDPETGAILPAGMEGVLELRAPQLADPDRWLRTTDKARLDTDRFLWITGRADAAIIRGGFKVQPDDVVRALERHPDVREAVVVGIPDSRLGQVPAAAIMVRAGADAPSQEALREWLRDRLLPYQVPALFRFVEDVPRSASMKPILPDVAAMFTQS
ncbi:MAG: long-chain fatty acid--CoA ligase [Sphingobium sp.]